MVSRRLLAAAAAPCLLCLVLASVLYSCGSGSDQNGSRGATKTTVDPLAIALVSEAEIKQWPAKSPEATLLRWWQSVQYHDADLGLNLVAPDVRRAYTDGRYRSDLRYVLLAFDASPRIEGRAVSTPNNVALAVHIRYYKQGTEIGVTPRIMRLRRAGGAWRLADLSYFSEQARQGRKAAARSKRSQ